MPIYQYICKDCKLKFEQIKSYANRDSGIVCNDCKSTNVIREEVTAFSTSVHLDPKRDTIYSPKEIDKVIGEESDKKWQSYDIRWKDRYKKRQEDRRKQYGEGYTTIEIPKDSDGKYSPVKHLGSEKEKSLKKAYSGALQEHREKRKEKGLGQFVGSYDRDSKIKVKLPKL